MELEEEPLNLLLSELSNIPSRVPKTDLDLLPIYLKTDDASMAHLHLGILAYWLVATIRYQLKQQGVYADWKEIVRTMNT
jgi:hypothetical protein